MPVLILAFLSGCEVPSLGCFGESQTDVFFLHGEARNLSQLQLDQALQEEFENRLDDIYLHNHLSYGHVCNSNNSKLVDNSVSAHWETAANSTFDDGNLGRPYPFHMDFDTYIDRKTDQRISFGRIRINGDIASLDFSLPPVSDRVSGDLRFQGSFSKTAAQTAVDTLRKSELDTAQGELSQQGELEFMIDWEISGQFDNQAFSHELTQVFRIARYRRISNS